MSSKTYFLLIVFLQMFVVGCSNTGRESIERVQLAQVNENRPSIINGRQTQKSSLAYRHTVGIRNLNRSTRCSGTIITERIILTAAHCFDPDKSVEVIFGVDMARPDFVIGVKTILIHPSYIVRKGQKTNRADLALVLLKKKIPSGFAPTPLIEADYQPDFNRTYLIVGYGDTDGSRQTGAGLQRAGGVLIARSYWSQTEWVIDQTQEFGGCFGDSGGPLYYLEEGHIVLAGVLSGVANPGESDPCRGISIYTNLAAYGGFLADAIKRLN